jgi:putative spermidine/putrescine transport system substrate-binding protein
MSHRSAAEFFTHERKLRERQTQAAVSSDIAPIIPRYDLYMSRGDWLNQQWTEMIAG